MKALLTLALSAAALLSACQDDRSERAEASPVSATTPSTASAPTCPCWDSEALAGALPKADACFDQTAAQTPFLSVDLFDIAAATQTQAFTRYDPTTDEAGSCRLVVVGTEGLVAEISAATGLPRAAFEGCVSILAERAREIAAGC
jgi:hypothetical protein